ncbi:MAG: GTPase Era [Anaerolineales bacterium]|nr:GTPase Era [Anaerolineales bacterium]
MEESIEQTTPYKSGFVAIAGRPNVGKSTLINTLMGQKIAAVTPRPQTTRRQQLGILTLENAQIIFVDTPGLHRAHHKLGEWMNVEATHAFAHSDVLMIVVDGSQPVHEEDHLVAKIILEQAITLPQILIINKRDLIPPENQLFVKVAFSTLFPNATPVFISAAKDENFEALLSILTQHLPKGDPFFPEDQVTDLYEREIAADLIRESALLYLRDEVPHSIAIRMDEFTERGEMGAYIAATLLVEKESHKPIVIGQGGEKIKQIGQAARQEIEKMSGRKVYLQLRVKVRPNWRNNEKVLQQFGFRSHQ